MKQTLIVMASSLIIVLLSLGCGSTNRLAAEIIYDAKMQVEAAKEANAQNLAPQGLSGAEQMLARSEEVLNAGKGEEAYRLGMRAHLEAKIAEAVAIANRMETEASSSESELVSKLQAVEAARRDLERAAQELEELQSTPEDLK
jgi:predicted transcriptional regulator